MFNTYKYKYIKYKRKYKKLLKKNLQKGGVIFNYPQNKLGDYVTKDSNKNVDLYCPMINLIYVILILFLLDYVEKI